MPAPSPTPPTAGATSQRRWIWPFELIEQIGEGGMGVVYRARYVVNNREVAVKMLPADVTDKIVLQRFERELEVLKSLKHPNIVRCFGGLCEDKGRFYAMELVTGGTLENELQRKGRLAWESVVEYGMQMCAALDWAHQQGVVHRDVKPSNFLLTNDGQLKLGDFGLATMAAARKITQAGKTAGTFLYMAPEQIRGQEVTSRTDLYALGCVFYELLTGRPPYVGDAPATTLHMHLKDSTPRVSPIALDCPATLDQIVFRLMEKDPADRFESAAEVARALRAVTTTITIRTPKRSLTVSAREAETEAPTKDVIPARAPQVRSAFPFWVTSTLAIALGVSLAANVQTWSRRNAADDLELAWIAGLGNPDPDIRIFSARTLGKYPHISDAGVNALSNKLTDALPEVRVAAAAALGDAGSASRPLVPMLIRMRKDVPDSIVREAVGDAIKRIGESPSRGNLVGYLLSLFLLVLTGGLVAFWYRSAPRVQPVTAPAPAGSKSSIPARSTLNRA